jgi:hypothetical protein
LPIANWRLSDSTGVEDLAIAEFDCGIAAFTNAAFQNAPIQNAPFENAAFAESAIAR